MRRLNLRPASLVLTVIALLGLSVAGMLVLHAAAPKATSALVNRDEQALTRIVTLLNADKTLSSDTDTTAIVRSVLPTGELAMGGGVRVARHMEVLELFIDHASMKTCQALVQDGFVPERTNQPMIWIDDNMRQIPGAPEVLCKTRADLPLTLSWKML